MNHQQLAEKLGRTQQLYIVRGFSNPTDCAQNQLQGRTHYCDPDTLRYHKSRILSARPAFDGLFYLVIESCALDYENTRRGFRAVLFDLFGEAVYRPSLDECRKTREPAEKDFSRWAESFDPVEHYRQALEARAERMSRTAAEMRSVFETEALAA